MRYARNREPYRREDDFNIWCNLQLSICKVNETANVGMKVTFISVLDNSKEWWLRKWKWNWKETERREARKTKHLRRHVKRMNWSNAKVLTPCIEVRLKVKMKIMRMIQKGSQLTLTQDIIQKHHYRKNNTHKVVLEWSSSELSPQRLR